MTADKLVSVWRNMSNAEQSYFADNIGEHLEKFAGVTSDAGRLGRLEGVDSRAVLEAIEFSCKRIEGES